MNIRRIFALLACLAALVASGCASQKIESFAGATPTLDLQKYFDGQLDAYGLFTDRSGAVVKRFSVLMRCSWVGDEGTFDESFTYSDGSTQKRIWHLHKTADGRFSGRADDVVGQAAGESAGNALHWSYTLLVPVDGTPWSMQFDDWMYLMSDAIMINRASMSKFGIHLGDVTLTFVKH
jgi:hypothetical protein